MVSTYIHLNPARAGLIEIGKDRLKRFRWSSYPWYLNRAGRRPVWLSTEKVMGSLGLRPTDRRGYEAYLEGRVLELAQQSRTQGAGCAMEGLAARLVCRARKLFGEVGKVPGRCGGEDAGGNHTADRPKPRMTQAAAEKALRQAFKALGLDESDLAQMAKSAAEKLVLAWWLRQRTTVGLRWVSERLRMGHFTRVSQAVTQ